MFRHPDHLVTGQALESQFLTDIKKISLKSFDLKDIPEDGLKSLYGLTDDVSNIKFLRLTIFGLRYNALA